MICERYTDVKYRVELNTEPDQKPLTLALYQRERELIAVIARDTPTWNTEPHSNSEKKAVPPARYSPLNRMSVSSAAALDLAVLAPSAG